VRGSDRSIRSKQWHPATAGTVPVDNRMEAIMATEITVDTATNGDVTVEGTEAPVVRPDVTPYGAFKVTNIALVRAGIEDVKVTPQSMYSRAAKDVIASYRDADDKVWFEAEAFHAWLTKFVASYVNGGTSATRIDYDALADEYAL
jgi:hypothetical protein